MGLAASLVTVLVNGMIHLFLDRLTDFERHRSVSRAALTGFLKSFAALFINTVLLLFIVNSYIRDEILQRLGESYASQLVVEGSRMLSCVNDPSRLHGLTPVFVYMLVCRLVHGPERRL